MPGTFENNDDSSIKVGVVSSTILCSDLYTLQGLIYALIFSKPLIQVATHSKA
jgi:hypothetical protein